MPEKANQPLYALIGTMGAGWYAYGILTDLVLARAILREKKYMYPGGEYRLCELVEIPSVEK